VREHCRTPWSPTGFVATRPPFLECRPKSNTSADIGSIIGRKTPISQAVNASGGCAGSSHPNRHSDFFPVTAPSVPISGQDVIGSRLVATEQSAANDSASGIQPCRPVRSKCHSDSPSCAGRTPLIHYLDYFRALTCQYRLVGYARHPSGSLALN
jgi:hypothetical protein